MKQIVTVALIGCGAFEAEEALHISRRKGFVAAAARRGADIALFDANSGLSQTEAQALASAYGILVWYYNTLCPTDCSPNLWNHLLQLHKNKLRCKGDFALITLDTKKRGG